MSTPVVPIISAVLTVATAMNKSANGAAAQTSTGTNVRAPIFRDMTVRAASVSGTTQGDSNVSGTATAANISGTAAASSVAGTATAASVWGTTARGASVSRSTAVPKPELTAEQKLALKHLHETAQQFESLFVNMLFKSMREAAPQTSITGEKQSSAETTFTEMLDEKRSESMAQTGAFGLAKVLEDQLKASVLANPSQAAKSRVAPEGIL
jgi:hypothetical protein